MPVRESEEFLHAAVFAVPKHLVAFGHGRHSNNLAGSLWKHEVFSAKITCRPLDGTIPA